MVKKRFISILCCLALVMGMPIFNTFAGAEKISDTQKSELIYALGITKSKNAQEITLKSFLTMMSNIAMKGNRDPMEFGVMMHMIDSGENSGRKITVSEAIKYAVITLGYRVEAERNGGDANAYINAAQGIGLCSGIKSDYEKNIIYDDAITLIYNMLEASPMVLDINTEEQSYKILNDETILSYRYDIKKIKGIVTAVPSTSLYKGDGCYDDCIEIDSVLYNVSDGIGASEFLGKSVTAYVEEEKSNSNVVYILADDSNNNEITIDAKDIVNVNMNAGSFEYSVNDKNKTAKINYPPKVIYNDRFFSDYTDTDFLPKIGSVRLLDNNNDKKYDVIFVESYKEMIVESRSAEKKLITGRKLCDSFLEQIELENIPDRKYKIYKNNSEAALGEISAGDTLLVKESKDNLLVQIFVSSDIIQGKITSWGSLDDEITIGTETYKITDGLTSYLDAAGKKREVGITCKFYINSLGSVSYMEEVQELNYYLYYKSYCDDDDESICNIMYMDMNNEWHEAQTVKKVLCDDVRLGGAETAAYLEGKKPQLVKMDLTSKGQVKSIELATETNLYNKDKFTRTTTISDWYYSNQRTINYTYYANIGAKVLEMPTGDDINDKSLYKFYPVESKFFNDRSVICKAYDIDEYNFASLFSTELTEENKSNSLSDNFFLVTEKRKVSKDEEVRTEMVGMVGRFSDFSYVIKDKEQADKIKPGDLVRYHLNEQGYVDYVKPIYSLSGDFKEQWNLPNNNSALISGTIELIDTQKGIMKLRIGGGTKTLLLTGTNTVMVYDKAKSKVRIANIDELREGSQVVINGSWHKIAAMYCIE